MTTVIGPGVLLLPLIVDLLVGVFILCFFAYCLEYIYSKISNPSVKSRSKNDPLMTIEI